MQRQPILVLETFAERFLTWRGTWAAALEARKASSARCSASSSCWSSSRWSTRPPWSPPWPTTPWGRPCRRSGCSCCSSCSPSPASRSPASARPTSSSSSAASHQPLVPARAQVFLVGCGAPTNRNCPALSEVCPWCRQLGECGAHLRHHLQAPSITTHHSWPAAKLLPTHCSQLAGCLLVACGLNGERERERELMT